MNDKEKIHSEADRIFNGQRENYSVSEMAILVQSQYYNIEDLFEFGANLRSENINEHISVSEKIFSVCNSFQKNIKLIPDIIGWNDSKNQISKVKEIKSEISKILELQKATKNYQDSPSQITAKKLQNITEKIQNRIKQ